MSAEFTDISLEEIKSFSQIIEHLEGIQAELQQTIEEVNGHLRELIKCGYYNRVSITFRCRIYEAILYFQATIKDLEDLLSHTEEEMTKEQAEMLGNMAKTALNLNTTLRFTWKTDSYPDDYSEQRFLVLAHVYRECSTMFLALGNLETLVNVSEEYLGN